MFQKTNYVVLIYVCNKAIFLTKKIDIQKSICILLNFSILNFYLIQSSKVLWDYHFINYHLKNKLLESNIMYLLGFVNFTLCYFEFSFIFVMPTK